MAIPLFDTATLQAPLHKRINERIGEVIERGAFILGPEVQAFERELAAYLGVRHVVGVGNGTKIEVIDGLKPGDKLVLPG